MYFETKDAALVAPNSDFIYDLTQNKNQVLQVGNAEIRDNTFLFAVRKLSQIFPQLKKAISAQEFNTQVLVLRWPVALFKQGTIEMISREGQVLWSYDLSQKAQEDWKKQLETWKQKAMSRGVKEEQLTSSIFQTQMGYVNPVALGIPLEHQSFFRFCMTQKVGLEQTRLCSRRYGTQGSGNKLIMGKVPFESRPRVLLQNEEAPLKGEIQTTEGNPVGFYADLASGESYEFIAAPAAPKLMDISSTLKPEIVQVVGYDLQPNQNIILLNPEKYSKIVELLGFQPTIFDPRKFWSTEISKSDPIMYFPGQGGGLFRHKIQLQVIPPDELRLFLSKRTLPGVYNDGTVLHGQKNPDIQVTTDQSSVKVNDKDPSLFDWKYSAPIKGEVNRSYLTSTSGTQSTRSYFEVYRGYGNELSGRVSGIISVGQGLVMGEMAYNHWFEDFFGKDYYYMAKQRWGVSFKYFKSLTQLKVNTGSGGADLTATTFDLKYRLTPGLWTREESAGPMLSYQSVSFDVINTSMIGAGWFWARSMPRSIDGFFNLLPLMRYPKWVDVEFIYYTSTLSSTTKLDLNYALNFHGQVLWKKNYFGEAGFGMKRYAFTDQNLNQKAELNTVYATVGMGLKF